MSGAFVSELKRRNVIRMAGLYRVGAWLELRADAERLAKHLEDAGENR
jgi:hypothetical protein